MKIKIIVLLAILVLLLYSNIIVYAQDVDPEYDQTFNLLIGGIQIEIFS